MGKPAQGVIEAGGDIGRHGGLPAGQSGQLGTYRDVGRDQGLMGACPPRLVSEQPVYLSRIGRVEHVGQEVREPVEFGLGQAIGVGAVKSLTHRTPP